MTRLLGLTRAGSTRRSGTCSSLVMGKGGKGVEDLFLRVRVSLEQDELESVLAGFPVPVREVAADRALPLHGGQGARDAKPIDLCGGLAHPREADARFASPALNLEGDVGVL